MLEPYQRLELEWAKFNDLDPAGTVACSSGTAALHLAFEALQLRGGGHSAVAVMSDYNMIACPRAAVLAGLTPRFVDCGDDLLIDDGGPLGDATVEPYSVFLATHVYGRRCDMDWLTSACGACHPVVEDLAEAHGIRPHPSTDAACWSFFKNKIVAGEEGGAVWFRDPEHANLARKLRNIGFTEEHDYFHVPRGHNYRLANCLAERVLGSLRDYQFNMTARRLAESVYDESCPAEWRMPPRDAPWVFDLRIPGLKWYDQKTVVSALNRVGIAARCGFRPMGLQDEFSVWEDTNETPGDWYARYPFQNSLRLSQEVFYLPLIPGTVTRGSARLAFDTIRDVVGRVER